MVSVSVVSWLVQVLCFRCRRSNVYCLVAMNDTIFDDSHLHFGHSHLSLTLDEAEQEYVYDISKHIPAPPTRL
jgi:hypothetical protein